MMNSNSNEDLKVCRVCLDTDTKLLDVNKCGLSKMIFGVTGLLITPYDRLPKYICIFCWKLLQKASDLLTKCKDIQVLLLNHLMQKNCLTMSYIKSMNRTNFKIPLAVTKVQIDNYTDVDVGETLRLDIKKESEMDSSDNDSNNIDSDDDEDSNDHFDNNRLSKAKADNDNDKDDSKMVKKEVQSKTTDASSVSNVSNCNLKLRQFLTSSVLALNAGITKKDLPKIDEKLKVSNEVKCNKKQVAHSKFLANLANNFKVDVIVLDKEQQIEDFLTRKERENYKRAEFKCELCCRGFTQLETFQNHSAVHDESTRPLECEICRVRFVTRGSLSHHTDKHKYKFACRFCSQVTRSASDARHHYKAHEGRTYPCEHCGKVFRQYKGRSSHLRIYHGAVKCEVCQKTFVGENGLIAHKSKAHREIFGCSGCGVQFHNADALRRHEVSAVDGCGPHVRPCTQCGDNLSSDDDLKTHMLQHMKKPKKGIRVRSVRRSEKNKKEKGDKIEKPCKKKKKIVNKQLVCEMCGAGGFWCDATLRYHQRIHTGEKPHACPHCPKTFRLKLTLNNHMKIHNEERPYKCPTCPKAFRQSPHLKAHLRCHTKERPYACKMCPKRYSGASALKEHVDTVHLGLPARRRNKQKQSTT